MHRAPNTLTIASDLQGNESLQGYAIRIGHVRKVSRLAVLAARIKGDGDMLPGATPRISTRTTSTDWDD